MDTAQLVTMPWYNELRLNQSGIWTIRKGECAVGVVLLAQQNGRIVLVRKAAVKGYEFSNMYSLPGGLVRHGDPDSFPNSLNLSVMERSAKECGLIPELITNLHLENPMHSPVTEYRVKGSVKRTLVLIAKAQLIQDYVPQSTDHSISDARLAKIPTETDWDAIAPANRLIIARAFSASLPAAEKLASRPTIDVALASCNAAAKPLGLPELGHPWDQ